MKITKDRIIFGPDDWIAGFSPQQANTSVRILGPGLSFMKNFDPFTNSSGAVPGAAQPGRNPTDFTNVATEPDALLVAYAVDGSSDQGFAIGGTKVQKFTPSSDVLVTTSWPNTLGTPGIHSGHSAQSFILGDAWIYNVSGTSRLFYSYNDNTDWDVGTHLISSSTPSVNDDFMSDGSTTTPLASPNTTNGVGKPHPMHVSAVDGIMYIGSGRHIHSYDGANNTFNAQDLDINKGFDVTGIIEQDYDLCIFASDSVGAGRGSGRYGRSVCFFWDASRPSAPYKAVEIVDDYVSAPFNFQGTMGCFTYGRSSNRTALRLYNGRIFEPVFYYAGNPPGLRSVIVLNNQVLWVAQGNIYSWGKKDNVFPQAAHHIAAGSGTTDYGFLGAFQAGALVTSTGTGTAGGLQKYSLFHSDSFVKTLTAAPNFPYGMRGRIKEVRVTFAGTASGGRALDVDLKTNSGQTTIELADAITSVAASTMIRRYQIDKNAKSLEGYEFENLRCELTWTTGSGATAAPSVEKVEVFYDLAAIISL